MKKKSISVLLLLVMLTGCSRTETVLLPYNTDSYSTTIISDSQSIEKTNLFATDLTVVSKDYISPEDDKLLATSSLLIDSTNNEILYGTNLYKRLYPASITKVMAALVVLKYGNLSDTVTISHNASNIRESGAKLCGFKEGDQIGLEALLTALLAYSGNDAGIAIAEHIAGTEEAFSQMMNEEALILGAVDSSFTNAHGLHNDNHYTTAYDLYLIFNELLKYEKFIELIGIDTYTCTYVNKKGQEQKKEFQTTNRYLNGKASSPKGIQVIGGKTGTTNKAGSCLILASKDSKEQIYISLVLNSASGDQLFSQMTHLLELIQ